MTAARRARRWRRRMATVAAALLVGTFVLGGYPRGARAAPGGGRQVLVIGSNQGLSDEEPLQHAVEDARRTAAVLGELAGPEPSAVRLLADPPAAAVLGALASLAAAPAGSDAVIVYFSGHGDQDAIHLAGQTLPLAQLRQALAAVNAPLKIIIIDACRTAGAQSKGLAAVPSFTVALPGAAGQYRGLVMLLASGPGEAAQESARLRGGVFTHFLVSGLRGAADRDGDRRVTLSEAYEFAHGRTLARSVAQTGAAQRPELKVDLEGSGPLVLTWLDPARSRLRLQAAADAHFYVYEKGSSALTAEAWGRADGETTLALPSGRFVVHRQLGASHGVAEVSLPFGGEARLARSTFAEVSAEEATARGGRIDVLRSSLSLLGGVVGDPDRHLGAALGARLLRARRDLLLGVALATTSLTGDTTYNHFSARRFDVAALFGAQRTGSHVSLHALADLTLRLERLRLRDRSTAIAARGGDAPSLEQQTLGTGPGLRLGASFPLRLHLAMVAEVSARALLFRERNAAGSAPIVIARELGIDTGICFEF